MGGEFEHFGVSMALDGVYRDALHSIERRSGAVSRY